VPDVVTDAGLTDESGWVPVDKKNLQTKYKDVYAIGDVTIVRLDGRYKPEKPLMLPKAGVFAHAQAEVVARRIAADITGSGASDVFYGEGYCMLEVGESLAGFASGNFFAEPSPQIQLRKLGKTWHLGKVLFEQWWLAPPGLRREMLRLILKLGSKVLRVPASF